MTAVAWVDDGFARLARVLERDRMLRARVICPTD